MASTHLTTLRKAQRETEPEEIQRNKEELFPAILTKEATETKNRFL
jgi:hypothetical protein